MHLYHLMSAFLNLRIGSEKEMLEQKKGVSVEGSNMKIQMVELMVPTSFATEGGRKHVDENDLGDLIQGVQATSEVHPSKKGVKKRTIASPPVSPATAAQIETKKNCQTLIVFLQV